MGTVMLAVALGIAACVMGALGKPDVESAPSAPPAAEYPPQYFGKY